MCTVPLCGYPTSVNTDSLTNQSLINLQYTLKAPMGHLAVSVTDTKK